MRKKKSRSKDPNPAPREIPLTTEELAEWAEIVEEFEALDAKRLQVNGEFNLHEAWRRRFWQNFRARTGVKPGEVDDNQLITDRVRLKCSNTDEDK